MAGDFRDELRAGLHMTKAQLDKNRGKFKTTSARIEKRAGRNLFVAIGTGLIFGVVFLLSLFLAKPLLVLLVAVLMTIAAIELSSAYKTAGRRVPRVGVALSGGLILAGAYWFGASGMLLGLIAGSFILTVWRLFEGLSSRWEVPAKTLTRDVFSGLFTLVYVPFFGSFAILLVYADGGEWWIFTMVAVVVSIDMGAYAAGVTLGKHKMTPRISPNKTWEGFAGAVVAGLIVATLCAVFLLKQPWWIGVILGILLLMTATVGDLTESLIKRNLGVKDMSNWVPGHGGFLDRLDSLLPSIIVAYAMALTVGVV